ELMVTWRPLPVIKRLPSVTLEFNVSVSFTPNVIRSPIVVPSGVPLLQVPPVQVLSPTADKLWVIFGEACASGEVPANASPRLRGRNGVGRAAHERHRGSIARREGEGFIGVLSAAKSLTNPPCQPYPQSGVVPLPLLFRRVGRGVAEFQRGRRPRMNV